jgi:hypothetical protein
MFREIMAIRTSQMMTSPSLICLLENQNGGKLQKKLLFNSNITLPLVYFYCMYNNTCDMCRSHRSGNK